MRGRGPPQVSSSGTLSTGSETGFSLVCHSPFRPCWLASGSQECSCPFSQCLHDGHTQLFMLELWIICQSLLLSGKLFTNWSVSSVPRLFFIGRIFNYWLNLFTHHWFTRIFFFVMLSWLQHVSFRDFTHFISFHNLLGYNCESILDPRGLLGSLTALQPGCNALALIYNCVLVTPPHHSPAKSLVSLESHQRLPPFLQFSYSLFHFLLLWFSFLSIAASRFGSPFFYFLWL